jgi:CubicO group peptidase (beta-lactamase class C family)
LGYSILQLVIERVTDEPYEKYVKENILEPLGIENAYIAYNYDNQRYKDEVRYYEVPEAELVKPFDGDDSLVFKSRGGNDIRTLGAAGGWVISSVDLIKFLLAIDNNSVNEDILDQNTILRMTEHEGHFHPFGWRWVMSNGKWWRSGSFPGTSALAVIRNDGFTYVFLTNSSPWSGARFPYEIDRLMSRLISSIHKWPEINLFENSISNSTFISKRNVENYQPFFTGKFSSVNTCIPPLN